MAVQNRVLMICDAFDPNSSGGRVAIKVAENLMEIGCDVFITTTIKESEYKNSNISIVGYKKRKSKFFFQSVEYSFREFLLKQNITHIHLCPFGSNVPVNLIGIAKKLKIKIFAQLWGYDYFCVRPYALRDGKGCNKCANGNLFYSLFLNCGSVFSFFYRYYNRWTRIRLTKNINYFLVPNLYLVAAIKKSGVKSEKIIHTPLPFWEDRVNSLETHNDNYVLFYGQGIESKGVGLLPEIIKNCPKVNFKLAILNYDSVGLRVKKEMQTFLNVSFIDKVWEKGLDQIVGNAKLIIFPSIWETTTETALLESIFLEKVIIAFDVGVHSELLKGSKMLIQKNNTQEFSQTIDHHYFNDDCFFDSNSKIKEIKRNLFNNESRLLLYSMLYS